MNSVYKSIDIDLYSPTSYEVIKAQQGDKNSRILEFTLYNQGEPYVITKDISLQFMGHRGNGSTFSKDDCITTDGNKITVSLTDDILYYAGTIEAKLVMFDDITGNVLSTVPFKISCIKNPCDESSSSDGEKSMIADLIFQVKEFSKNAEKTVSDAKEYADASYENKIQTEALKNETVQYENYARQWAEKAEQCAGWSENFSNMSEYYRDESLAYARDSQSYAVGTNGEVRENDMEDCAKYYYNQCKYLSERIARALNPMGTVSFENLPALSDADTGDMYNIINKFVTTSDFKEGADHPYPAGTNVYKTVDGYWDCLAGIMVTSVNGQTGDVEISAEDINVYDKEYMDANFAPGGKLYINDITGKGWYRVAKRYDVALSNAQEGINYSCVLSVKRYYSHGKPEYHKVQLLSQYQKSKIVDICSASDGVQYITAVRHTVDASAKTTYLEIYYNSELQNPLNIALMDNVYFELMHPELTEEAVSGVSVLSKLELPANFDMNYLYSKLNVGITGYNYRYNCIITSCLDLNEVNETGLYFCETPVNGPDVTGNGFMIAITYAGKIRGMQLYMPLVENKIYKRQNVNDSWGSWTEINAVPGVRIITDASVDLNDYKENGFYYISSATSTVSNLPVNVFDGWLSVISGKDRSAKQIFYRHGSIDVSDLQTYVRTYFTSSQKWSNWKRFVMEGDTVASATKATQDGNGNVIATTYATKSSLPIFSMATPTGKGSFLHTPTGAWYRLGYVKANAKFWGTFTVTHDWGYTPTSTTVFMAAVANYSGGSPNPNVKEIFYNNGPYGARLVTKVRLVYYRVSSNAYNIYVDVYIIGTNYLTSGNDPWKYYLETENDVADDWVDSGFEINPTIPSGYTYSEFELTDASSGGTGGSTYEHPAGAGYEHIPSGGSTCKGLFYGGSSGTAVWQYPNSLYGSTGSSAYRAYMSSGAFRPDTVTTSYSIGNSSYPWYWGYFRYGYFSGGIFEAGESLYSRYLRRKVLFSGAYCSEVPLSIPLTSISNLYNIYDCGGSDINGLACARIRIWGSVANTYNGTTLDEEVLGYSRELTHTTDYGCGCCSSYTEQFRVEHMLYPKRPSGVTASNYYIVVDFSSVTTCSGWSGIQIRMSSTAVADKFYILGVEIVV